MCTHCSCVLTATQRTHTHPPPHTLQLTVLCMLVFTLQRGTIQRVTAAHQQPACNAHQPDENQSTAVSRDAAPCRNKALQFTESASRQQILSASKLHNPLQTHSRQPTGTSCTEAADTSFHMQAQLYTRCHSDHIAALQLQGAESARFIAVSSSCSSLPYTTMQLQTTANIIVHRT